MSRRVTRFGTAFVASVAAAALCTLVPVGPAAAHNSLTGSDPRDGARIDTPPKQVRLSFLARLDPATTRVTVTGPDDASVTTGEPTFSGSRVTVPVRPLAAGRYVVRYEVASGDGHPIRGDIEFTLTVPATPSSAPTSAPVTPTAAAPASPVASAEPVAAPGRPAAAEDGATWWPWALGAGAVAVAALVGGLLWRARSTRRPGSADRDPAR
ncbi:copper resistance CopC family protein [Micromonospora sp. HM5-17]|uniref:copper resistance CopC family protein n=1 Tax=Micromonospora sp. HM5-17 TaxID=2487710 RepID=UPI000F4A02C6|nr:copper resistance CopC family protein [Micromonospora sp. HM5-17]ROT26843.1 copper resistance protein CopC [Micromonospora sp. HM5-17]